MKKLEKLTLKDLCISSMFIDCVEDQRAIVAGSNGYEPPMGNYGLPGIFGGAGFEYQGKDCGGGTSGGGNLPFGMMSAPGWYEYLQKYGTKIPEDCYYDAQSDQLCQYNPNPDQGSIGGLTYEEQFSKACAEGFADTFKAMVAVGAWIGLSAFEAWCILTGKGPAGASYFQDPNVMGSTNQ
jgi:hypothetical protein